MNISILSKAQTAVAVCALLFSIAYSQPDTLWMRTYGEMPNRETGERVIRTSDGGYAIGGKTNYPYFDYLIVKVDSTGDQEWLRVYAPSDMHDIFGGVAQVQGGGYVLAGLSHHGLYANIFKVNSQGDSLWSRTYGDSDFDDVVVGRDGLVVAAGNTDEYAQFGAWDAYLVKVDDEGEVIWRGVYGGQGGDQFGRIIATSDGGYLMAGETTSFGGLKGYIVKADSAGAEEWSGGYGSEESAVFPSVIETPDGGYLAGGSQRVNNVQNFYCVKLTSDGEEEWSQVFHYGREGCHEQIKDLVNAPGGGYFIVGYYSGDYSAIRLDNDGNPLWSLDLGDLNSSEFRAVLNTDDNGYLISGTLGTRAYSYEAWLVRLGPDSTMLHEGIVLPDPAFPSQFTLAPPFPNPFNSSTTIGYRLPKRSNVLLQIFDVNGRIIKTIVAAKQNPGSYSVNWNAGTVPAGLYFCRIDAGSFRQTDKLVLLK